MHTCCFTEEANTYLNEFRRILETMEEEMTCAELGDSISRNFIVQMLPHHRAAIKMSENILKYSCDRRIRAIASGIIAEQTESIRNMEAALGCCSCVKNTERDLCSYEACTDEILKTMFHRMAGARQDNCINCNFLREMLPHHKGAVKMSENALRFPICPELVPILDAIITSQKKGIAEMERLLCCFRCRK